MSHSRDARALLWLTAPAVVAGTSVAHAAAFFNPSALVVSESTFVPDVGEAANLTPGSDIVVAGTDIGVTAIAPDTDLGVFTNSAQDGNFGITSPLTLVQINPTSGASDGSSLALPTSQSVTSFSSKSEGSLFRSTNGTSLTIAGYSINPQHAPNPIGTLDVSNANTTATSGVAAGNSPGINRTVAQIGTNGKLVTTDFNAYSGNNPRGVMLVNGQY